uniref:Angio-associated migratory cell protein n=1 Tax=Arion vulgaris TaxID=1028688 RepID=A0A0B7B680_9EUPU
MADLDPDDEFSININEVVKVIDLDNNDVERDDSSADSENEDDGDDNDDGMDTEETLAVSDDSALSFVGHKDSSVICVRLNPVDHHIAVTGGQDDQALVWNTQHGSVIFQCTGHTDTVASVGFSHDGSLVATADMKGLIKAWKLETGAEVWSFDVSEVEWIQWHHSAPILLAGTKDGQVWMWKIPSGECKTFPGYGSSATCGKILPDGKVACVGYEDGSIKIWDLKTAAAVHTVSGHEGHQSSVFCIDTNSNGSLVLTGSGDMAAKVINITTGKVVSTLKCSTSGEEEDSVEAVGFSHTHDYAVTGTLGGNLEIWDLPTKSVRHRCDHPFGVVKVLCSPTSPLFYTACLDGNLRQFDIRNGQLTRIWHGHVAPILDFELARNEDIIITASDDSTAKVFSLKDIPS